MDALRLNHLSWHPAGAAQPVLDGVALAVGRGEVVALLGPSGAGKTSLLRLVAGLEAPTRGRVEIGGADVTALGASDRPVGLVAQNARLFPDLTVLDNVAFRLRLAPAGAEAAVARARHTLRLLGIEPLASRRPDQLSEGEQQRVALARALATSPALLLLDEPMSHLDRRLRRDMRREILELQARLGLALVYVTHDQGEAMAISDRIALLHQGRVIQQGTPRQLYEHPASDFVAAFMGDMRLFEGWVDGGAVRLGPLRLALALGLTDRETLGLTLALAEGDIEALTLALGLIEGETLGDLLALALGLTDGETEADGETDGETEGLAEAEALALGLTDGETLRLALALADGLADLETLALGLTEGEIDGLTLALPAELGEAEALTEAEGLRLDETEGLTLADGLTLRLTEAEALGLALTETEAEGETLGLTLGLALALAEADGDTLGETL